MNEKFARWELLFSQNLKRDWKKMIVWILGIGLFAAGFVPAFEEIAKGQGLVGMYEIMKNPAMISMVGTTPILTASDYTIGAMYAQEMLLFCGLFAMIVSILHIVSHTRKEEELGLTELVRSFQIGRQANSLAAIVQVIFINLILALVIPVTMISFSVETITVSGSLLFGLSVGMAGLIGAGIALLMAQIMPTSSGATGASLGIVGLLYIIRAVTDVSNADLSLMNPMGWTYLTNPFTENNWLPLLFGLIFTVILIIIGFALEGARDMGSGYLPEREGRATAKRSLLSVRGLLIQINKGTIISWLLGFVVMGVAYGSIYGDMQVFIESNELIEQMFSAEGVSMEASFTGTIMMVMIGLVSILPITIVNKLYTAENRLYLSQIYATKVTRRELYWTSVGLAVFTGLVGILLSVVGLGGTAMIVMDGSRSMTLTDFLVAGFNFLPSVLFFISLAALALGWAPRLGKAVHGYLVFSFMLNYFSGIIDLPEWFLKTSIKSWIPHMPTEDFDLLIFVIITVISITLMVLGSIGYRRRDLQEGA